MDLSLAIAGASCKCVVCQSPLSIFPIFLYEAGSICGRCALLNEIQPSWIRNSSYETIAQFVKFPCQYQNFGCQSIIIPSKMKDHEDTCKYKQYPCPMLSCRWRGELDNIYDHYTDVHANFILTNPRFELDLINKYDESYLIPNENVTFIFHISFDNKEGEFCYSLYCLESDKTGNEYIYTLEFTKQFSSKNYTLPELPANGSDYSSFNKTDAPKISVKDILNELEDPLSVVCAINIDLNPTKARRLSLQKEIPENHFLSILECPVCQEYMIPPIYQCLAGHAICNTCIELVTDCPECRGEIANTRNFRLEQITEHIEYPCKYTHCQYTGKADKIKEHEATCFHSIYSCLFKKIGCQWNGSHSAILDHVHEKHPEEILEVPVIGFFCGNLDGLNYTDRNILPACGQLFAVGFKFAEFKFSWTVQFVGPKADAKNYCYELDFKDNSGSNKRIFIRQPCSPMTEFHEMFDSFDETFVLHYEILESLIDGKDLVYSCNVTPA